MRAARTLTAALACLALGACREVPYEHLPRPDAGVTRAEPFRPPAGLTRLRLGLVPYVSKESMQASHARLVQYLSAGLGVPIEVQVGDTYADVAGLLARGEVEFAEFSPYSYVLARDQARLRPLVMAISDGSNTAAGYVVVRQQSPLRTLDDLRGKSFAYVDRASTSGFLYPRKLLRDRGLDPETYFGHTEFVGNHEAVLLAVLEGKVEAGATYQGAFAALRRSKGVDPLAFRVIAKMPRTPRDLYVIRADLPPEVGDAIARLLLEVSTRSPAGREILEPMRINGFVPADPRDYDDVEKAHLAEVRARP